MAEKNYSGKSGLEDFLNKFIPGSIYLNGVNGKGPDDSSLLVEGVRCLPAIIGVSAFFKNTDYKALITGAICYTILTLSSLQTKHLADK